MRTSKALTLDAKGNPRRSEVWEAWHEGWHLERLEAKGTPLGRHAHGDGGVLALVPLAALPHRCDRLRPARLVARR